MDTWLFIGPISINKPVNRGENIHGVFFAATFVFVYKSVSVQ